MNTTRTSLHLAAATAALLFALTGVLQLLHDQADPFAAAMDYAIEGAFVAALAAGGLALRELRTYGARIPLTVAVGGHAALVVAAGATFVRGEDALDALFGVGFLAITVGFLGAAVLDARGRVAPRGVALALLVGWIATVALDSPLAVAAGWLGLAAARRPQPAL